MQTCAGASKTHVVLREDRVQSRTTILDECNLDVTTNVMDCVRGRNFVPSYPIMSPPPRHSYATDTPCLQQRSAEYLM